jgi:hypothetical protein
MKWKTDLSILEFDFARYKRVAFNSLSHSNEKAGQAWIKATVLGVPIPTWGGASRATFEKLARELGTSVPIGTRRAGYDTAWRGRATSTGSGVVENKASMFVGFVYKTSLGHLIYNEYNRAVAGRYPKPWSNRVRFTPYRFQDKGLRAWKAYAKKVRLPNPFKYIKRKKL